jgi:Na+-driven multidrug efflux pump
VDHFNALDFFGQPSDVSARTTVYFRILMASMVPALVSIALKNHADALNRPWPPFWIFLGGVLLNIGLNWVMIYGKLGCPALGFEGAAWATLIARCAILIADGILAAARQRPAALGAAPLVGHRISRTSNDCSRSACRPACRCFARYPPSRWPG